MQSKNVPKMTKNRSKHDPKSIRNGSGIDAKMMMDLRWHFGCILGILEAISELKKWGEGFQLANNGPSRPHGGGGGKPSWEGTGKERGSGAEDLHALRLSASADQGGIKKMGN